MKLAKKIPPHRFTTSADVPKSYRELCQLYLPRPIRDASEKAAATAMMNASARPPPAKE